MTTIKYFFILIFTYLITSIGYSADSIPNHNKEFYFMGAGGDPAGDTTIFDKVIQTLGRFSSETTNDWKTTISLNGGHKSTEALISKRFTKADNTGAFTEKNLNDMIADIESKLQDGRLKSGDQLMLLIDTHGAMKTSKEKTHSVALSEGAASELKGLSGAHIFSMDKLQKIIDLAAEKGVKLALMDFSCYSGNTLSLLGNNLNKACLISASGPNQYSYIEGLDPIRSFPSSSFSGKFVESLKAGKNLEELFLTARKGTSDPDFPMISTVEGRETNDFIYNWISPFLNYNQSHTTDFSDSYDEKIIQVRLRKPDPLNAVSDLGIFLQHSKECNKN